MPELVARGAALERDRRRPSMLARLARVSYMFLVMNYSAVAGVVSLATRRKVWRS
jgi:hypothetical protein